MKTANNEMLDLLSEYALRSDIYAAKAIAKISMSIFNQRKELKMTQKQFAKMMGVSQGMVSKWESAEYNFTIETIAQIAERLHMVFEIELKHESEYLRNIDNSNYSIQRLTTRWKKETAGNFFSAA